MNYSDRILNTPASFVRRILGIAADSNIISFAGGLPNPSSFPLTDIQTSLDSLIGKYGDKLFQYATTPGYEPLRQYIADKYNKQHNLGLTADDILITTGSQQALDLIGKAMLNEGDGLIIEEPGYLGAIQAFSVYQPDFMTIPFDENGLDMPALNHALQKPNVKCMYTVPNFQNPSGLTYSKESRQAVAAALKGKDIFLIEDDPYGELRFRGEPLPYIGVNDPEHSVLLGSFSKTITPGMRLGFIISRNKEFMNYINIAKQASDLHTNIFVQYVIYDYLTNNDYYAHIEKIINMYRDQSDTMLAAIDQYFPDYVRCTRPDGGMFIWATLPEGQSAMDLFDKAMAKHVAFVPGNPFYVDKDSVNTLRLNYTNSTDDVINEGIKRLGSVM